MKFELVRTDGGARHGVVTTDHGAFETPAFMPVGTQGTVKAMTPKDLSEIGTEIILSNTYHLYLRPGVEVLRSAGGLHEFMGWTKPILTDSGGYQVFSLADLRKIEKDGVTFRSHLDGSSHLFTPESVVGIQRVIGSDIMMLLDECPPYPSTEAYVRESNDLTVAWARRCKSAFEMSAQEYGHSQALFGIVQGSVYPEIRKASVMALGEISFDGYAIGGLAVGEPFSEMCDIVALCTEILPADRPRYLMGVGTPADLMEAISRGVDMFDCVLPTRNGRNAMLFTRSGTMTMTNAKYKADLAPADESCGCYSCRNFSRAYLRHLFMSREVLALHLATCHNLYFYQWLMRGARNAIRDGTFAVWKEQHMAALRPRDSVTST